MATIFRSPLIARTLPNPPYYHFSTDPGRSSPNCLVLKGKDTQFADAGQWKNYDYPTPPERPYLHSNRTYTLNVDLNLLSKDVQFAGAGQWKSYDYPTPPAQSYVHSNRTWTFGTLPFRFPSSPFAQLNWPVPLPSPKSIAYQTWLQSIDLNLLGQDQFFAAPGQAPRYDYPVPPERPYSWSNRTWLNVLDIILFFPSKPFNQNDWPTPLGRPLSIQLRTWLREVNLNLLGRDQFFYAAGQGPAYDYPTPPARPYTHNNRTWVQGLLIGLGLIPFAQLQWPTPPALGRAASNEWRTWLQKVNIQLIGKDKFFGAPGEPPRYDQYRPFVPLPQAARQWTWSVNPLLYAGLRPFRQTEWPSVKMKWQGIQTGPTATNIALLSSVTPVVAGDEQKDIVIGHLRALLSDGISYP